MFFFYYLQKKERKTISISTCPPLKYLNYSILHPVIFPKGILSVIYLYSWNINKYLVSATQTKLDHGLKKSPVEVWCTNVVQLKCYVLMLLQDCILFPHYVYFYMDIRKIWFDSPWNLLCLWFYFSESLVLSFISDFQNWLPCLFCYIALALYGKFIKQGKTG